jgi:hypothetical protein
MNRVSSLSLRPSRAAALVGCMLLGAALSAPAQTTTPLGEQPAGINLRRFPDHAERGQFQVGLPPEVSINGKAERLAPGARIFNPHNMIVLSGSISGQSYIVNYTRDTYGLIKDVWILSPQEQAQKPPAVLKRERERAIAAQQ